MKQYGSVIFQMTGRIFEIKKSPGFFLTLNSAPTPNLAPFDILKEFPCAENTNKKIAKFKWKGQPFCSRLQGRANIPIPISGWRGFKRGWKQGNLLIWR